MRQRQARALGDPTRYAIFTLIAEADRPVDVPELTRQFELNHNAIRQHLAKLIDAGLLMATKAPVVGRGRPRFVYEVAPAAAGQLGSDGPYEQLSRLLAEIIRTGRTAVDVGHDAAERFRVRAPSGDVVADVSAAMTRQGFDPEVRTAHEDVEVVLHRCPFASTADTDRVTVCSLHLGLAEGLVEGTELVVDELVAHEPRAAGCRLHLRRQPAGEERPPTPGTLTLRRGTSRP
jgi:predicted ArsR family transcriptional regulator